MVWQVYDDIRALPISRAVRDRDLLVKVAMLDHSCELDNAAELMLAPAAPNFGTTKCTDQIAGLSLKRGICGCKLLKLILELTLQAGACRLETLDSFFVLFELLGYGANEFRHDII